MEQEPDSKSSALIGFAERVLNDVDPISWTGLEVLVVAACVNGYVEQSRLNKLFLQSLRLYEWPI